MDPGELAYLLHLRLSVLKRVKIGSRYWWVWITFVLDKLARKLRDANFSIVECRNFSRESSQRFVESDFHFHQKIVA